MTSIGLRFASLLFVFLTAQLVAAQPAFRMPRNEASFAQDLLRLLEPPSEAKRMGSSAGQSDSDAQAHQMMKVEMPIASLLSLYQDRLVERAWQLQSSHVEGQVGIQTWSLMDSEETPLFAVLIVATTDSSRGIKVATLQVFLATEEE